MERLKILVLLIVVLTSNVLAGWRIDFDSAMVNFLPGTNLNFFGQDSIVMDNDSLSVVGLPTGSYTMVAVPRDIGVGEEDGYIAPNLLCDNVVAGQKFILQSPEGERPRPGKYELYACQKLFDRRNQKIFGSWIFYYQKRNFAPKVFLEIPAGELTPLSILKFTASDGDSSDTLDVILSVNAGVIGEFPVIQLVGHGVYECPLGKFISQPGTYDIMALVKDNYKYPVWERWGASEKFSVTIVTLASLNLVEKFSAVPKKYSLLNYPNPFNPTTTIRYSLAESGSVRLTIYDMLGKQVAVLVDGFQQAGEHQINWNAAEFPSGNYFCRLKINDSEVLQQKMTLLK